LTAPSLVALTGATGFIGAALLSHLTDSGCRVRALYRPRAGRALASSPGVEWLPGDLGDSEALRALVAGPMPSFTARARCGARDKRISTASTPKAPAALRRQPQEAREHRGSC
jgi:nucleoside-diphosphate-sugar epimerase